MKKLRNIKANQRFADGKCIHFPKNLMKVSIVLFLILTATIVTATLIIYFGEIDTKIDIKQSVTIDNKPYNKPIKHNVVLQSGDSISFNHIFRNRAKTCHVSISQTTSGLITGLTLRIYDKHDNLITFPFRLNASSNMEIIMTYSADINLEPQKVKIVTRFSVKEL